MKPNRRIAALLVLFFIIFGGIITRHSSSFATTTWMDVYSPHDFPTFISLLTFLARLRMPIPPVISALEIINVQISGDTKWVTDYLYRAALIGSYVIVMLMAYPSIAKMMLSFAVSIIMLAGTVIIHPPYVYDILFPFFLLMFFFSLRLAAHYAETYPRWSAIASCGAGFALSMTELSRPFFFILFLIPLGYSFLALKRLGTRKFIFFLIPIVLFTGVWHLHQFVSFGQIVWDNHSGFNLQRVWLGWPGAPLPTLTPEPDSLPLAPGRFSGLNFNTSEHGANSALLRNAVIRYCASHPMETMRAGGEKILNFVSGPTSVYYYVPQHPLLTYYRVVVQIASAFLIVQFITFVAGLLFFKVTFGTLLEDAGNVLFIVVFCSLLFFSLGDKGEEARFLLSLLPLLAIFPECWKGTNFNRHSQVRVSSILLTIGIVVGILVFLSYFTDFLPIPFRLHKEWFIMLSAMCGIVSGRTLLPKNIDEISRFDRSKLEN